jgi:hypothetical protein
MEREARAFATSASASAVVVEMIPRIAPHDRMWRVSARVSIPKIPTIPASSR